MNKLEKYFLSNTGRSMHKCLHYFDIYDRHFKKFCGKEARVMELGVNHGGSLEMWRHYFGAKAKIYGLDRRSICKQAEGEQIEVLIGDVADEDFRRHVIRTVPKVDVFIDDGSHQVKEQISTLKWILPKISQNGVYLCEDVSYEERHGAGFLKEGTFIEYIKNFVDFIQGVCHKYTDEMNSHINKLYSLCIYDSIVVIEKRPRFLRTPTESGNERLE